MPRDWVLPYPFPPGVGLPDSPGLKFIIRAYLYDEYSDDDDLQAFVAAQNDLAQQFLDWFNATELPVYTDDSIAGLLLDWVGAGLYGMPRPSLSSGSATFRGSYGTFFYGESPIAYGERKKLSAPAAGPVSDDIYKRVLTWHFFKGDGKYFTITWLKKRVMRFLIGVNGGSPNIDQTHQISVVFGPNRQASIIIYNSFRRSLTGPGAYGMGRSYGRGPSYGAAPSSVQSLTPFSVATIFKEAVDQGILELPFQWNWACTVIG